MATVNEKMTAIADKIREYSGETRKINLDEMVSGIQSCVDNSHYAGLLEGREEGKALGEQEMHNAFWKCLWGTTLIYPDVYGKRKDWSYAFYGCEFGHIGGFNPPECITVKTGQYMFSNAWNLGSLTKSKIDLSGLTNSNYMFYNTRGEDFEIEEIDVSKCGSLYYTFCAASLRRIGTLILNNNGTQAFSYVFSSSIREITTISGVIGRSITFQDAVLTPNSAKVVINALADYSTKNTLVYTMTFCAECWAALEADSTAPDGGTWKAYVNSKGWNV